MVSERKTISAPVRALEGFGWCLSSSTRYISLPKSRGSREYSAATKSPARVRLSMYMDRYSSARPYRTAGRLVSLFNILSIANVEIQRYFGRYLMRWKECPADGVDERFFRRRPRRLFRFAVVRDRYCGICSSSNPLSLSGLWARFRGVGRKSRKEDGVEVHAAARSGALAPRLPLFPAGWRDTRQPPIGLPDPTVQGSDLLNVAASWPRRFHRASFVSTRGADRALRSRGLSYAEDLADFPVSPSDQLRE